MNVTVMSVIVGVFGRITKSLEKRLENRKFKGDHPNQT